MKIVRIDYIPAEILFKLFGVVNSILIGHFFFHTACCLHFLEHNLPQLLGKVLLNIRQSLSFLHVFQLIFEEMWVFLNNLYSNRWTGPNAPIRWPARSPDLNPCEVSCFSFLCNSRKNHAKWHNVARNSCLKKE